jgi:4-diphosphocytidyl-2-C-methyl-D-erythritol kinase
VSRRVRLAAPAKVNLTLEVLGERADGYHEIASVMATIDLHDDVRVAPSRALEVRIRPDVGAPKGEDLASRAARALAEAAGREPGVRIEIRKRIPVAAGLGGGSSDAAAALRALAVLWRAEGIDLINVGATIGSDVPFFVSGHAVARVGGRGERVDALPAPSDGLWIALVTIPVRLATADVFRAAGGIRGDGRATAELAKVFASGHTDPAALRSLARNDLTAAAERMCRPIADARAAASARGVELVLSGSGPSLFAIADDRAHAIRIARSLRRAGLRARARCVTCDGGSVRA